MMRPKNAPPTQLERFETVDKAKVDEMSPEELAAHRASISILNKHLIKKLAETATTKVEQYDLEAVITYIMQILADGYDLKSTTLSAFSEFRDAQKLRCFKDLIADCVERSAFGRKAFKIHELRFQQSAIARSKTLHELRQNVDLMIGPLTLYRELSELKSSVDKTAKANMEETDELLLEIEEKDGKIADQSRMLSEILGQYDPSAKGTELFEQIERYKATHGASDIQAAKVFNTSPSTIKRLRRRFRTMDSNHHHQTVGIHGDSTIARVPFDIQAVDDIKFIEDVELF